MGNICRSPAAEGFFRHHAREHGLASRLGIDSAGTHSYHLGCNPDERAVLEAGTWGVDISALRARRIEAGDFDRFDRIVAMDYHNVASLERIAPAAARAEISLMMDYATVPGPREVPDPYYGGRADFRYMCQLLDDATRGLLAALKPSLGESE